MEKIRRVFQRAYYGNRYRGYNEHLRKIMKRAIVTFLSTLIVGYIALVLGRELLNHIPE